MTHNFSQKSALAFTFLFSEQTNVLVVSNYYACYDFIITVTIQSREDEENKDRDTWQMLQCSSLGRWREQ